MQTFNSDTDIYRRNLPHLRRDGASYFVTFRLTDSIPPQQMEQLKRDRALLRSRLTDPALTESERQAVESDLKRHFARFDQILDSSASGPLWLGQAEIADRVYERILELGQSEFQLDCFTIMANHVHLVMQPCPGIRLDEILRHIKQPTAFHCNRALARKGKFWQDEYHDHIIRDREWERIVRYVLNNPVKAGLVKSWREWKWTFLAEGILAIE